VLLQVQVVARSKNENGQLNISFYDRNATIMISKKRERIQDMKGTTEGPVR
jgi:hypothetical protein